MFGPQSYNNFIVCKVALSITKKIRYFPFPEKELRFWGSVVCLSALVKYGQEPVFKCLFIRFEIQQALWYTLRFGAQGLTHSEWIWVFTLHYQGGALSIAMTAGSATKDPSGDEYLCVCHMCVKSAGWAGLHPGKQWWKYL